MKYLKYFILLFVSLLLVQSVFCGEYRRCRDTVTRWIDKTYAKDPFAQDDERMRLRKILSSKKSDNEKIADMKREFSKAFSEKEKSLIYLPPLTFKIHSLVLGYEVRESATQTIKVSNILDEVQEERSTKEVSVRRIEKKSHDINAGGGFEGRLTSSAGAGIKDFQPTAWLTHGAESKLQIHASYNFNFNNTNQTAELLSDSQQKVFSEKNSIIKETLGQTTVFNRHLAFTLSITNNTSESMRCYLSNAFIPITLDGKPQNINATPTQKNELIISARETKLITFEAGLDKTYAEKVVDCMSKNYSGLEFDIKCGSLQIESASYMNATAASMADVALAPVSFMLPGFNAVWNIRCNHTSNDKPVTLREALNAIEKDFQKVNPDIFKWENGTLAEFTAIPFGRFSAADKKMRYLVFLKQDKIIHSQITKNLLDKPLSEGGCELIMLDVQNLDDLKKASSSMQKEVFNTVKILAKNDPDGSHTLRLGNYYFDGIGIKQDKEEAVKCYRKAAEQGYAKAQNNLGLCYFKGEGVKQDKEKAVELFRKVANQGDAKAQGNLGWCYLNGEGVKQDKEKAVELFRKAADQGYAMAQFNLGWCYFHGEGVEQNKEEAVRLYRKAADKKFLEAQLNLGWCYFHGEGVKQDKEKAVELFRKAADQGDAKAQGNLGWCYLKGEGVKQDKEKAVELFRKAADQGYAMAQFNLGLSYQDGNGVEQDYKKAFEYFCEAAKKNLPAAQFALGWCYEWGQGVEQNKEEAVKRYRKAAAQGHKGAKECLENLENK